METLTRDEGHELRHLELDCLLKDWRFRVVG